jgi:hypothetical protein
MKSELETLVSFLYKSKQKEKLSPNDLYMLLSFELGWFSPGESRKIVELARQKGLLKLEGDLLSPAFDYRAVQVPIGFRPSKKVLEREPTGLFNQITGLIERAGIKKDDELPEINRLREKLKITPETAATLFAYKKGIEVNDVLEQVEKQLEHPE